MKIVRSILVLLACTLMLHATATVYADTADNDLNTGTYGLDGECYASFAGMCGVEIEGLLMESVTMTDGEEEEYADKGEEDTENELLIMLVVIIVIVAAYSAIITITSRAKNKDAAKANFKTTADPTIAASTVPQDAPPTKTDVPADA